MSEMNNSSMTEYYHGKKKNRVYAKLTNVPGITDEIDKNSNRNWSSVSLCLIEDVIRPLLPKMSRRIREDIDCGKEDGVSYIGMAECDSKDVFSLEVGKKIASLKADLKYHDRMDKDYDILIEAIDEIKKLFVQNKTKHVRCYNQIFDKLVRDYGWSDNVERGAE